ncbi:MAG: NADH-quinone oxidoreductase subunit N, partial [Planctomycetaceae bacterium]|nr:NADH-quinone oxidoreductase subunit N [Planctomycetaceae bacterium]
VVYGAGAAGVMIYGISLLAGVLGTGDMSILAERFAAVADGETASLGDPEVRTVVLGTLLILVGIAFKLSLVPFHFWCPDAFEGASAEVGGFLSVASKAGAFALLIRLMMSLTGAQGTENILLGFGIGLGVIGCVTTTFGNLAAYTQTNMKRLLAYSTIAHAGYMVMAVSALLVLQNGKGENAGNPFDVQNSIAALLYYLAVYLFMNLGAFAVIAIARNHTFSEDTDSVKGLVTQAPVLCIVMLICMFSLVGMPPFGGFFAKFMIFASVLRAGQVHWFMYLVLVVGGLNTVFSLVYYLRVLKVMFIDERPKDSPPVPVRFLSLEGAFCSTLAVLVLILGIAPQIPDNLTQNAKSAAEAVAAQSSAPAPSTSVVQR